MKRYFLTLAIITGLTMAACGGDGIESGQQQYITPPAQSATGLYSLVEKGAIDWDPAQNGACSEDYNNPGYSPYHGTMEIFDNGRFIMEQCYIDRPHGGVEESCWETRPVYPMVDEPGIIFKGDKTLPESFVSPYLSGMAFPYYYTYGQGDQELFLTIWGGEFWITNLRWCIIYSVWEKISD